MTPHPFCFFFSVCFIFSCFIKNFSLFHTISLPLSNNKWKTSPAHQGDSFVGRADWLVSETDHFEITLRRYLEKGSNIFSLACWNKTAQTGCPANSRSGARRGSNLATSAKIYDFLHFFSFLTITSKVYGVESWNFHQNLDLIKAHLLLFSESVYDFFRPNYSRKTG